MSDHFVNVIDLYKQFVAQDGRKIDALVNVNAHADRGE